MSKTYSSLRSPASPSHSSHKSSSRLYTDSGRDKPFNEPSGSSRPYSSKSTGSYDYGKYYDKPHKGPFEGSKIYDDKYEGGRASRIAKFEKTYQKTNVDYDTPSYKHRISSYPQDYTSKNYEPKFGVPPNPPRDSRDERSFSKYLDDKPPRSAQHGMGGGPPRNYIPHKSYGNYSSRGAGSSEGSFYNQGPEFDTYGIYGGQRMASGPRMKSGLFGLGGGFHGDRFRGSGHQNLRSKGYLGTESLSSSYGLPGRSSRISQYSGRQSDRDFEYHGSKYSAEGQYLDRYVIGDSVVYGSPGHCPRDLYADASPPHSLRVGSGRSYNRYSPCSPRRYTGSGRTHSPPSGSSSYNRPRSPPSPSRVGSASRIASRRPPSPPPPPPMRRPPSPKGDHSRRTSDKAKRSFSSFPDSRSKRYCDDEHYREKSDHSRSRSRERERARDGGAMSGDKERDRPRDRDKERDRDSSREVHNIKSSARRSPRRSHSRDRERSADDHFRKDSYRKPDSESQSKAPFRKYDYDSKPFNGPPSPKPLLSIPISDMSFLKTGRGAIGRIMGRGQPRSRLMPMRRLDGRVRGPRGMNPIRQPMRGASSSLARKAMHPRGPQQLFNMKRARRPDDLRLWIESRKTEGTKRLLSSKLRLHGSLTKRIRTVKDNSQGKPRDLIPRRKVIPKGRPSTGSSSLSKSRLLKKYQGVSAKKVIRKKDGDEKKEASPGAAHAGTHTGRDQRNNQSPGRQEAARTKAKIPLSKDKVKSSKLSSSGGKKLVSKSKRSDPKSVAKPKLEELNRD